MKNKITSEEIQKSYLEALENNLNSLEKKYLSAPEHVLLNKGLFKFNHDIKIRFNNEYIIKHDEFVTILIENKKNLNPTLENSLNLFIFAYCRFQEYLGWINNDEANIYINMITDELKNT